MTNVGLLLKCAATLAGVTAPAISKATGIAQQRVTRILNGRTPPSEDEPDRILRACGLRSSLLTSVLGESDGQRRSSSAPHVGSSCVLEDDQIYAALIQARDVEAVNVTGKLCIDNLTFTFNVDDEELVAEKLEPHRSKRRDKKYKHLYRLGHIHIAIGLNRASATSRTSRVEFASHEGFRASELEKYRESLLYVFDRIVPDSVSITRIDVSVDYEVSIRNLQALAAAHFKPHFYVGTRRSRITP